MSEEKCTAPQETHKEESKSRMQADTADRSLIREKLEQSIDPLVNNGETDIQQLVNIVSGRVAPVVVNVDNAFEIGTAQMIETENTWPAGFYGPISKKVTTMEVTRKHVKIGTTKIFNTTVIYSRVIGLQASSRESIDIKDLLSYELAPVPTAMFTDSGDMRIGKTKAQLKTQLKLELSTKMAYQEIQCRVLDGSAILWVIPWPLLGTVRDYVSNFRKYIEQKLNVGDVYLVFDRYWDYSTKSIARSGRATEASRVHLLNLDTPLPSQKVVLTVSDNKKQLIDIICSELTENKIFHHGYTRNKTLVITGSCNTPVEIRKGVVIYREDISTSHEEADCIIVQQAVMVSKENKLGVSIVANDTDVLLLILHHYLQQKLTNCMLMESPINCRPVIDIRGTVRNAEPIALDLLAFHALTGCDTVACYFGIGKVKALKILRSGYSLSCVGDSNASLTDVTTQATRFVGACYGHKHCSSMSGARQMSWAAKVGKGSASTPQLNCLPPSTEAFIENVKRAHIQACMWKHALDLTPPQIDPLNYGFIRDSNTKSLLPKLLPADMCNNTCKLTKSEVDDEKSSMKKSDVEM